MYLTVRMKFQNGDDYLSDAASAYTRAVADFTEASMTNGTVCEQGRRYVFSSDSLRKAEREAKRRVRMIRDDKISAEDPIPEHCVFSSLSFSFDLPRRVLRIQAYGKQVRELVFRTDHYRMILLNELRPLSLRVEQRDGVWYGWLLGYISEEKYWNTRDYIREERAMIKHAES